MPRWVKFLLALLAGLIIGLIYGWYIDPVRIVDTSPDMLRQDFQTDIVLMVSELYTASLDLDQAEHILTILFSGSPIVNVSRAVAYARELGYSPLDIVSLQYLEASLQAGLPGVFP